MTREEAIAILEVSKHMATSGRMYNQAIDLAIEALKRKPILCSHCKHYIRHDHRCGWWNHGVSNVDWCSYAERREL